MKKSIFFSLTLTISLFVTTVANASDYSVANFYTQVVNSAFIKGMKEKDSEKILTQNNIDCILSANNQKLFSLINNALKKELSADELHQANNFINSRIGQMLQDSVLTDFRNGTNTNIFDHIDVNQFSDIEITNFMNFTNSSVNEKLFMGDSMKKLINRPEIKKPLTEIAKEKIINCGLTPEYFFK